jgi:hypothetical protein
MAEQDRNRNRETGPVDGEAAASASLSLSQALLGPLDALFKAQVHAARSFLNYLLQLGYPPHEERGGKKTPVPPAAPSAGAAADPDRLYQMSFSYDVDGHTQTVSVPVLSLVPVSPLGITSAEFEFDFFVRSIAKHKQFRKSIRSEEPGDPGWYLVDEPKSLRGTFAPASGPGPDAAGGKPSGAPAGGQESRIRIKVNVGALPPPASLEKLLATLGQLTRVNTVKRG